LQVFPSGDVLSREGDEVAIATNTGAAERTAAGGAAARALYERHQASIYRYALSQLRSREDAEDAVQNTFLRAFRALDRGVVPQNEVAWLFKIAHNVCLSSKLAWLRRRRVETPRDLDDLTVAPMARESRRDELVGLEDALASLPPRLREALLLREWQGLSYAEIADRLDTSRSAVETLIFRARRALAAELEAPARRLRQALGIGPAFGWLRGLLTGGSAALKAAGVVAVVAGATIAAKPLYAPAHHSTPRLQPTGIVQQQQSTPSAPAAGATVSSPAPQRATRTAHHRGQTTTPTAPPTGGSASSPSSPSAPSAARPPAAAPSPSSSSASPTPALPKAPSVPGITPPPTPQLPSAPTVPSATLPTAPSLPPTPTVPSTTLPSTPSLPPTPTVPSLPSVPAAPSTPPLQSTPTVPAQTTPLP
jgi:RNA polymerase sigma factor (sigma-70 family)